MLNLQKLFSTLSVALVVLLVATGCGSVGGTEPINTFAGSYSGDLILGQGRAGFDGVQMEDLVVSPDGTVTGVAKRTRSVDPNQIATGTASGSIQPSGKAEIVCTFQETWAGTYRAKGTIAHTDNGFAHGNAVVTQTRPGDTTVYQGSDVRIRLWYD